MMWRRVIMVFIIATFLLGVIVMLYPLLRGAFVDTKISMDAKEFLDQRQGAAADLGQESQSSNVPPDKTMPYPELFAAMQAYNARIWEERQSQLCDPWSYQQPSFSLEEYGVDTDAIGVICIPKLQLEMPIYLGATTENMAKGAVHLSQTSLPIGGMNTNCVLAGHRGYNGAAYFRYITDLEVGDTVTITNLWETLTYSVVDTEIIDPTDIQKILIQENHERLTLLTCHPYASGGRQRYVVYCERNKETEEM